MACNEKSSNKLLTSGRPTTGPTFRWSERESTMNIGGVVTATVDQVEQYGIFLSHHDGRLFVQIPDIDWVRKIPDPREFTEPGITFDVLVLAYCEDKNVYSGSIKGAYPELDPWRDSHLYKVGTKHEAKTLLNTEYGTFVELKPGLEALIYNAAGGNLEIGITIKVKVSMCDPKRRRMQVDVTT